MRPIPPSLYALPILFSTLSSAVTLDCSHIREGGKKFDFSKLGGPHSVMTHDESRPPAQYNTTYTIDICSPLKKSSAIPNEDQCKTGTNVCAIVKSYNPFDDPMVVEVENVISIAGNFAAGDDGRGIDPSYKRLKADDSDTEGLRVTLHGGYYAKKEQQAIIEFQCDKSRTGNEVAPGQDRRKRDDDGDDTKDKDAEEEDPSSLRFVSYGPVENKGKEIDVLRMNWRTKYACEDYEEDDDDENSGSKSGSWGFFIWFILILFLGIAAYIIFGSWLNYNRYGARGWDLLPHGDTIRDLPFLVRDWFRKVIDTVQGGGPRGGYSAV